MKIKILSIFALIAIISVESCKGPEGPIGPVGPTGTVGPSGANGTNGAIGTPGANGGNGKDGANGATGATGAKGETGNANVVYSDWKPVSTDKVYSGKDAKGNYTFLQFYPSNTKEPIFTKEAMNTAAIYTYVKFNVLIYDQATQINSVSERIKLLTENGAYNSFLIAGRNKDLSQSYGGTTLFNSQYAENHFDYLVNFNLTEYDFVKQNYVPVPEFQGKSLTYFQDIAKTMPQYRHVVVYGSTKGRMASINWKDYDEVKRMLNLKN